MAAFCLTGFDFSTQEDMMKRTEFNPVKYRDTSPGHGEFLWFSLMF